jgi:hypothetical protein
MRNLGKSSVIEKGSKATNFIKRKDGKIRANAPNYFVQLIYLKYYLVFVLEIDLNRITFGD